MLKPDEIAKKVTEARKSAEWVESRFARTKKLDAPVRFVAQSALGRDDKGNPKDGQHADAASHQTLTHLQKLDQPQLVALAEALFPRFAPLVKAAIELHDQLPYRAGHTRKSFRASNRKELHLPQKTSLPRQPAHGPPRH